MAQWFRMASATVATGSITEEAERAVSSRAVQAPVAAERIRVRRRTRTRAAMREAHSVPPSAPAGSKTSTRRSSLPVAGAVTAVVAREGLCHCGEVFEVMPQVRLVLLDLDDEVTAR